MRAKPPEIIESLPFPAAVVGPNGAVTQSNASFRALAPDSRKALDLETLFGPEVLRLLEGAGHAPVVDATLPLAIGPEPRPSFRVALSAHRAPGVWTVMLIDVTEDIAFRRRHRDCARAIENLREIGSSLSESLEIDGIADRICVQVARLMRTANFYVALYDAEDGALSFPRYLQGGEWRAHTSRALANGLTEYVLRTGRTLILNGDVDRQARDLGIDPLGPEATAWLGVPMIVHGEPLGVIATQSQRPNDTFDTRDAEIMNVIAGQAAAAIKHATLVRAARRAYDDLSEAQARLLESERIRGITEAVGGMNHEINNPLAAIVGNAQLILRRRETNDPALNAKVESILEASRRIQEVAGKMSTLIQATSRPYPGEGAILDLRHSVAEGETCTLLPDTNTRVRT